LTEYLGYHPVYLVMAIGCGSKVGSWMNDSGFWVVCKMGGLTEEETLKSWTMTLVVMGVAGLALVALLTQVLPLR
jgi:GntP family gluconate:H+ symporter